MPLHLITGPAGSGKTRILMGIAKRLAEERRPAYWVGLPHQRERTLSRLARIGTLLGVQFVTLQQLYYRLLEDHPDVKPLAGPGLQLAHVAQAIVAVKGRVPSPGEASLYHRAIKEAKRASVKPERLPQSTRAERDLVEVYAEYERLTRATWDYEDYRAHALERLEGGGVTLPTVIVDGFIDLHPTDVVVMHALARHTPVYLALEDPPETLEFDDARRLDRGAVAGSVAAYKLPNPVQETRWVLRSLKRDLAAGVPMHELLVVTPERHKAAFLALAPEYGVPLTPATPPTLRETPAGRLLALLLTFATAPDRHTLHVIPDLRPVAEEMTRRNLHGRRATEAVAAELGLQDLLAGWASRLTPPEDAAALPEWVRGMVDLVERLDASVASDAAGWRRARESLLLRGSEASVITAGPAVAVWWAHLLGLYPDPGDRPRGVPLAAPLEATGVTAQRAYVTRATAGEYSFDPGEDHFVPEDERADPGELTVGKLPRRIAGRTRALLEHLRRRGHEVVITYPLADQENPLVEEKALTGGAATPAPTVPAGSARETRGGDAAYRPRYPSVATNGSVRVTALERFIKCPFRARFEDLLGEDAEPKPWRLVLHDLLAQPRLGDERIDQMARMHPSYAPWLERHRDELKALTLQHRLDVAGGVYASVHAMRGDPADPRRLELVWFGNPEVTDEEALRKRAKESWERKAAAHQALATFDVDRVALIAWPIGFEPVTVYEVTDDEALANAEGLTHVDKLKRPRVEDTLDRYRRGDATPKPGFHCRTCRARDVCRAV